MSGCACALGVAVPVLPSVAQLFSQAVLFNCSQRRINHPTQCKQTWFNSHVLQPETGKLLCLSYGGRRGLGQLAWPAPLGTWFRVTFGDVSLLCPDLYLWMCSL